MAKFEKGQSGNPLGRPKGSSRINELRKRLHSRSDELIDSVINAAIAGDMSAMKMCLDRIMPILKPQETNSSTHLLDFEMPCIDTNKKIADQIDISELSASQLHDLLTIIKLKTELANAEMRDDYSVEERQLDKFLSNTHQ
ncbi:MAG: DUF5681 domain-containing protein [Gammaproteobacteria bacterium]|nr:DUF5681 domain-containing protein [Gammaproteobacteria bacterium]